MLSLDALQIIVDIMSIMFIIDRFRWSLLQFVVIKTTLPSRVPKSARSNLRN